MADDSLPMFPLGSVLFPGMPLPLRVFEPRYLQLLQDVLASDPPDFGVVLIERGHEVGGGDQRFAMGTTARLVEVQPADGLVVVVARGADRFEVVRWLDDAPYPRAVVNVRPALEWDESWRDDSDGVEQLVRRVLRRCAEKGEPHFDAEIELSEEPLERLWQVAAIAPLGELDQHTLLRCESVPELLDAIVVATMDADERLDFF